MSSNHHLAWIAVPVLIVLPGCVREATWVPGRWTQQPDGGWVWLEGHWA